MLVSHDRHLLRVTSDQLWLVDAGEVTTFAGDLDDYPGWLAERRGRRDLPTAKVSSQSDGLRKAQRRAKAEQRRNLQPLKSRLAALETRLAELAARRGELERELASPLLYEPAAKSRLLALMEQKQRLDADLEATETAWLEISEVLENRGAETPSGPPSVRD